MPVKTLVDEIVANQLGANAPAKLAGKKLNLEQETPVRQMNGLSG